ncbi:hypothetical protein TNCV_1317261 [Trichonephila clavipes]|nr:hypothetical protein TNCV_1317261 [Trichonephila clavipes]
MRGTLPGQRYVDDILRPHVEPFLNGLPGATFLQDNARPHTARVAQDFLHVEVEDLNEPHTLNQADWSDLIRDLDLPKQKAELLASRLWQ